MNEFVRGKSKLGWAWGLVLTGDRDLRTKSNGFDLSVAVVGVVTALSPLCFRRADIESWLPSRWRPILPSFSIAMKLVRTLESGLATSGPGTGRWY